MLMGLGSMSSYGVSRWTLVVGCGSHYHCLSPVGEAVQQAECPNSGIMVRISKFTATGRCRHDEWTNTRSG